MKGTLKLMGLWVVLLSASVHSYAQDTPTQQRLSVIGSPAVAAGDIIADREENYDVNGNLVAGLRINSDLQNLKYESSLGIHKIQSSMGYSLLFLSPEERVITVYHKNYDPLKIVLKDHEIALESGAVWVMDLGKAEKRAGNSGTLTIAGELTYVENEIIADRKENRNEQGVLAAGIKVYSTVSPIDIEASEMILKVEEEQEYSMVYIMPSARDVKISGPNGSELLVNLSDVTLESGSVYTIKIE